MTKERLDPDSTPIVSVRVLPNADVTRWTSIASCINSTEFRGYLPGTLLLRPQAEERYTGDKHEWIETVLFEYRETGWNPVYVASNGDKHIIPALEALDFNSLEWNFVRG